jgi:hypothetical protein
MVGFADRYRALDETLDLVRTIGQDRNGIDVIGSTCKAIQRSNPPVECQPPSARR